MATQPISNLVTTWNAAGTTFTAIKMNVTDTASAAGSLLMDLQVGGSSRFSVVKTGYATLSGGLILSTNCLYDNSGSIALPSGGSIAFGSNATSYAGSDTILARDAANTLAQRNGTNAQAFRVYNTFTDASNYERGFVRYAANVLEIGHEALGTGNGGRPVAILAGGTNYLSVGGGTGVWSVNTSGHLLCATDNTRDIGASGANRPRNLYVASQLITGGSGIGFTDGVTAGRGFIQATTGDGIFRLVNQAGTDFGRLQFGGTTSSFPALKRNGPALDVRLADDSNFAGLNAGQIYATAGSALIADGHVKAQHTTAIPAGGTAGAGLMVSSTANFGVFFGSGAPTLSAAKGSLYLRSDGTTTNDRAYINTNGSTTWTALTTAA